MWLLRTAVKYQVASIWPFKVFTAANTIVMLCGMTQQTCSNITYICTLLLIPFRNSSFIRIVVLPIHNAVCQPLQLSTCLDVHPQGVKNLHWSSLPMLSFSVSQGQGPLILVYSMGLTHPHNSGFSVICYGIWNNVSYAPTSSRNALLYSHHVQLHIYIYIYILLIGVSTLSWWGGLSTPVTPRAIPAVA